MRRVGHDPGMGGADTYGLVERVRGCDDTARGPLMESLRVRLVLWCATRMSRALREEMDAEDADVAVGLRPAYAGSSPTSSGSSCAACRIATHSMPPWIGR